MESRLCCNSAARSILVLVFGWMHCFLGGWGTYTSEWTCLFIGYVQLYWILPNSFSPVFFWYNPTGLYVLLLLSGRRCPGLILHTLCLSSGASCFSEEPWFFWRGDSYFKTKVWVLVVVIATEMLLLWVDKLGSRLKKTVMCLNWQFQFQHTEFFVLNSVLFYTHISFLLCWKCWFLTTLICFMCFILHCP